MLEKGTSYSPLSHLPYVPSSLTERAPELPGLGLPYGHRLLEADRQQRAVFREAAVGCLVFVVTAHEVAGPAHSLSCGNTDHGSDTAQRLSNVWEVTQQDPCSPVRRLQTRAELQLMLVPQTSTAPWWGCGRLHPEPFPASCRWEQNSQL